MTSQPAAIAHIDPHVVTGLLGEIRYIEEVLEALEEQSVGIEEVETLVGAIQRDIAHLYDTARTESR